MTGVQTCALPISDIPDNVYEGIGKNKAEVLHLFIRRGMAQAKFSVQELRAME